VRISIDLTGLNDLVRRLEGMPERMNEAAMHALNRAGDQAVTLIGRELAEATGAGVRTVREHISTKRANFDLEYIIEIAGEAMPLSEFAPRETQRGISARPWGERRTFPGTFHIPAGGERVFARASDERLPLKQLWGPSPAKEFERGDMIEKIRAMVGDAFERRFRHEIGRLPGGLSRG
jgi:hypothetical protein